MTKSYTRTVCWANYTAQQLTDMNDELDSAYKIYFGWLSLPVAVLALLLAVIYSITVYWAIRGRRVSRKCYVLLLNKTMGDIVCCLAALIAAIYVLASEHPNHDLVSVFENFFMASFWSAVVSYVSISAIKLYAVWQPLHYRKIFIMRRCIYIALFSWFVFGLILFFTLSMTALVKIPSLNIWSGCRLETCLRIVYVVRHYTVVVIYFFTIFVYILTIIFIKRAEKFAKKYSKGSLDKEEQRSRFPLWKLSCRVATFAGLTVFYVIWSIFLLSRTDPCFPMKHFVQVVKWLGIVRCLLMLRIQIDPLISFITDDQIRYSLIILMGLQQKLANSRSKDQFKCSEDAYHSSLAQSLRTSKQSVDGSSREETERTVKPPEKNHTFC